MSYIICKNIKMGYEGSVVFDKLSFAVNKGDYLCIVGENGSGKSTLMKGLLGLISPISGTIEYGDGLEKKYIGYLPQQTDIQSDFPSSVFEVVLSGTLNRRKLPFYSKEQKKIALENMEKVGISELKNKCFQELSGGQQQRVLLSRALSATSKLIILDEPISGLDPLASQDLYDLVAELNKGGITVVMVSHDITSAVNHASHILHLSSDGFFYGSTHRYMHSSYGEKFLITDCPCDDCRNNKGGIRL
ncbi:MAG: ABC transporter ATP-binding protein [Ruminococcus sp.]|nr:ABC transporter ATP-binding protein [Ruminococcus sp.]